MDLFSRPLGRTAWCLAMLALLLPLSSAFSHLHPLPSWPAWQQAGAVIPTWERAGYDGPQLDESLQQVANIGATWVELTPTWYQETSQSTEIMRTSQTVSDEGLDRAIQVAHGRKLKVLLKPHVDVLNGESRTRIDPSDSSAWYASYRDFIGHYADTASRLGVEQFSVGADLSGISGNRPEWLNVIQDVRRLYDGTLLYAAAHDEYQNIPFWDLLDVIGIEAYWPLAARPTTDVSELTSAWRPIMSTLAEFAHKHHRQILFTEAGYTSQAGTVTAPDDWKLSSTPAPEEQAAAYQALMESLHGKRWWTGVFWWVWNTAPLTSDTSLDYSFDGKPAEFVVRRWWSSR